MTRVLRPLIERTTWRRWSHLVVGGALLMPYWFVSVSLVSSLPSDEKAVKGLVMLLLLPGAAVFVTGLVPTVRLLEGSLARELLAGPAAALVPGPARSWESRFRAAAWFGLHLYTGVIVSGLSLAVPPMAFVLLLAPAADWDERLLETWGLRDVSQWAVPLAGCAALAALLAVIVGAGAGLSRLAPFFLGPSAAERLADAEARAVRLAERNRLARELHDSVGHALSVVTLQAGAAGRVLDSDPAFAREALGAIEESARAALEDLDHVLGLLREDPSRTAPQPTLKDLGRLLEQTRIAGVELDAEVAAEVADVPAAVSREAYRIVQEALTNALRHAGKVPVRLRLGVAGERLEMEISNPLGAPAGAEARHGGGRGLNGIRERATVLRGELAAGPDGERWRVRVSLPLRSGT
ncbi:sensor histidine kinase [Actinomadura roseirufa]|uniref:sensor histidine kinase n=1 Tax=Actinomadura roseirufa TaxID=2094049 RepID=UPI001F5EB856|nr:histidine kinase [Actinomadura roseirufa]